MSSVSNPLLFTYCSLLMPSFPILRLTSSQNKQGGSELNNHVKIMFFCTSELHRRKCLSLTYQKFKLLKTKFTYYYINQGFKNKETKKILCGILEIQIIHLNIMPHFSNWSLLEYWSQGLEFQFCIINLLITALQAISKNIMERFKITTLTASL